MTQFEQLKKIEKLIKGNDELISNSKEKISHLELVKANLWIGGVSTYQSYSLNYYQEIVKKELKKILDNLISEEKRKIESLEIANHNIKLKFIIGE